MNAWQELGRAVDDVADAVKRGFPFRSGPLPTHGGQVWTGLDNLQQSRGLWARGRARRSRWLRVFGSTLVATLLVAGAESVAALSISTARQVVWVQAEKQWAVYGSQGTYNVYGCHKPNGKAVVCFAWADAPYSTRCYWRSRTWQVQSVIFYRHSDPVCGVG